MFWFRRKQLSGSYPPSPRLAIQSRGEAGNGDPACGAAGWDGGHPVSTPTLVLALVLTILLCLITKLATFGWMTLVFGIPYLAICAIHAGVHASVARRVSTGGPRPLRWVLGSHAALVGAFLFQIDFSDADSWLTVTALLGWRYRLGSAPWWLWDDGMINLVVFVPTVVSWLGLWRSVGRR